uniref:Protein kinase domain-containing protein n=1 Tax=Macrostomum lignano TaxID=282301 RepID=A0A1I8FCX6_9PLAT
SCPPSLAYLYTADVRLLLSPNQDLVGPTCWTPPTIFNCPGFGWPARSELAQRLHLRSFAGLAVLADKCSQCGQTAGLAACVQIRGQQSARAMLESAGHCLAGLPAGSAWPAWPGSACGRPPPSRGRFQPIDCGRSIVELPARLAGREYRRTSLPPAIPPAPSIACCCGNSRWRSPRGGKIRLQRRQRRQHRQSGVEVGAAASSSALVSLEKCPELNLLLPMRSAATQAKLLSATSPPHRRRQKPQQPSVRCRHLSDSRSDNASPSALPVTVPVQSQCPVQSSAAAIQHLATLTCRKLPTEESAADRVITDRHVAVGNHGRTDSVELRFELEPGRRRQPPACRPFKRQSQRQRKSLSMSSAAPRRPEDEQRQASHPSTPPRKAWKPLPTHTDADDSFLRRRQQTLSPLISGDFVLQFLQFQSHRGVCEAEQAVLKRRLTKAATSYSGLSDEVHAADSPPSVYGVTEVELGSNRLCSGVLRQRGDATRRRRTAALRPYRGKPLNLLRPWPERASPNFLGEIGESHV